MNEIGIFFGTDTGTTRLIAKKLAKKLGDELAAKPLNVNRIEVQDFLQYDALILGTPTYGQNQLPGTDTGIQAGSWAEFLPQLETADLRGKCIALYGLGNQEQVKGVKALFQTALNHTTLRLKPYRRRCRDCSKLKPEARSTALELYSGEAWTSVATTPRRGLPHLGR